MILSETIVDCRFGLFLGEFNILFFEMGDGDHFTDKRKEAGNLAFVAEVLDHYFGEHPRDDRSSTAPGSMYFKQGCTVSLNVLGRATILVMRSLTVVWPRRTIAVFGAVIGGRPPEKNIAFAVLRSSRTMTGSWQTQLLRASTFTFESEISRNASALTRESGGSAIDNGPTSFVSWVFSSGGVFSFESDTRF